MGTLPRRLTKTLNMKTFAFVCLFAAAYAAPAAEAEAEADPQLLINAANFYTAGSVVSPVNSVLYNAVKPAAAAVTYTKPVVTAAASNVVNPVVCKTAVNPVVYKTPVNPVVYKTAVNPVVYNTAAHPVHLTNGVNSYANSVGAVHVTKREAEAEAEADP